MSHCVLWASCLLVLSSHGPLAATACKPKVEEVEQDRPLDTVLEEFEHGEHTYRDGLELHRLALTAVKKGENHTLVRRRDELNATMADNSTMLDQGCRRDKDQWGITWEQARRQDVEVTCRGNVQVTPLFLACWAKQAEVALLLLEEGADPNLRVVQTYAEGELVEVSALAVATGPRLASLREALMDYGADGVLKIYN
jgi:hypothetical protein